jgi:hypothetical protein
MKKDKNTRVDEKSGKSDGSSFENICQKHCHLLQPMTKFVFESIVHMEHYQYRIFCRW